HELEAVPGRPGQASAGENPAVDDCKLVVEVVFRITLNGTAVHSLDESARGQSPATRIAGEEANLAEEGRYILEVRPFRQKPRLRRRQDIGGISSHDARAQGDARRSAGIEGRKGCGIQFLRPENLREHSPILPAQCTALGGSFPLLQCAQRIVAPLKL